MFFAVWRPPRALPGDVARRRVSRRQPGERKWSALRSFVFLLFHRVDPLVRDEDAAPQAAVAAQAFLLQSH